jgi:putative oxidoreductase
VFYVLMGVGLIKDFKLVIGLMTSKGIPVPNVFLIATILIWFAGGGALLARYQVKCAALGLLAVTVLVTLVIHNFWTAPPALFANEMQHFLKNVAICGALLTLAGL